MSELHPDFRPSSANSTPSLPPLTLLYLPHKVFASIERNDLEQYEPHTLQSDILSIRP